MLGKPDYDLRSAGRFHCASHQCRAHRWGGSSRVVPTDTMRSIQGLQNVLLGLGSCATVTYQGAANDRPCRNEPSTFVLGYQHQQLEHREWLLPNLCRQLICRHRAQEHHPCAARLRCRRNGRACMPACRRRGVRQAGRHDSDQRRNAVRNTGRNQPSSHRHRLTHPWPTFEHEVGDDAVYAGQSAFAVFRNTTG
jgi:hypothetical protein